MIYDFEWSFRENLAYFKERGWAHEIRIKGKPFRKSRKAQSDEAQ
jgi:hypothetical protein